MKKILFLCGLVTALNAMDKSTDSNLSEEWHIVHHTAASSPPAQPSKTPQEHLKELSYWANNHPAQASFFILGGTFAVGIAAGLTGYYICNKNNS